MTNFWHLRGIARFYKKNVDQASEDILRAVERETWDILPIENFNALLMENFAQKEALDFWQTMLHYVAKLLHANPREAVLKPYIENMVKQNFLSSLSKENETLSQEKAEELFWLAVQSQSKEAKKMAIEILSTQSSFSSNFQKKPKESQTDSEKK